MLRLLHQKKSSRPRGARSKHLYHMVATDLVKVLGLRSDGEEGFVMVTAA